MSRVRTGSATVAFAARGIPAAFLLATLASGCIIRPEPMTGWTKGMGLSGLSIDQEGFDDRLTTIDAPDQILSLGYRWPAFSVEGLFSFTRDADDDDSESSLLLGGQAMYYLGDPRATTRPVVGLSGFLNRESFNDESSTRPGAQGFAGVEWRIFDDVAMRFGAVYGFLGEDEDNGIPKQTWLGARADFFGGLPTRSARGVGDWVLRSGVSWDRFDPDGEDSFNSLTIPSPMVGFYYEGFTNDQLRFGADMNFRRASFGDASQMQFNLLPALEYDLMSSYQTSTSVRIRALAAMTYQSFDSGSSDASGTVFGFGGGVRVTTPMWQNYTAALGADYLMLGESEDLFMPETNALRFILSVERSLHRGP